MLNHNINYLNIGKAIHYYIQRGYQYIEVPWYISPESIKVTFDGSPGMFYFENQMQGALVGSAEQSLYEMMLQGSLKPGKYVAASPCFRPTDKLKELHQVYFFKVELMDFGAGPEKINSCILDAQDFFEFVLHKETKQVVTDEGIDLELNSIEIGSYGFRKRGCFQWVYGTGIAEPRFSMALKNI